MGQDGDKGQRHYSKDRPQGDCLKMGSVGFLGVEERGKEGENRRAKSILFCFVFFWKCEAPRAAYNGASDPAVGAWTKVLVSAL